MADICRNETRCCVVEGSRASVNLESRAGCFMFVHGSGEAAIPWQVHNSEYFLLSVVVDPRNVVALHKVYIAGKLVRAAELLAYLLHTIAAP